jgi:HD superfamily phosphohydrolase
MADRYVLDPLHGRITFPSYIWQAAATPEVQRLREVRMCNINSLNLTGAGGVHRFEHSLGTAYLAAQCANAWPGVLRPDDERFLLLAALLHDVGSAGFGHSVEYILDSDGFRHEALYDLVVGNSDEQGFAYKVAALEPVFFGAVRGLSRLLGRSDLSTVAQLVQGKGLFGPLVSGTIDLDNIDNVYRLAYHMGLAQPGDKPVRLARSISCDERGLVVSDDAVDLIDDWRVTRELMYRYLLLNPEEFAAKCMLERALVEARRHSSASFKWHDVDFGLMEKLSELTPKTQSLISRIMLGNLFSCVGIFSTPDLSLAETLSRPSDRERAERELSERVRKIGGAKLKLASIALHVIKDVGKTQREVRFRTTSGREMRLGSGTRRVLVGVFISNQGFGINEIDNALLIRSGAQQEVRSLLENMSAHPVTEVPLYSEGSGDTQW